MARSKLLYLALMTLKSKRLFAAGIIASCPLPPSTYIPCDFSGCVTTAMSSGVEGVTSSFSSMSNTFSSSATSAQTFGTALEAKYATWASDISIAAANQQLSVEIQTLKLKEAINAATVSKSAGIAQVMAITQGLQTAFLNSLLTSFGNTLKLSEFQDSFIDQTLPPQMYQMISLTEEIMDLEDHFEQLYELEVKMKALESMEDEGDQIYALALEKTRTELKEDIMDINTSYEVFSPNYNVNGSPTNPVSERRLVLLKQEKNNMLENFIYRQKAHEFIDTI